MKKRILSQKFFNGSTLVVAKELLGKFLVRKVNRKTIAAMIMEVEAYDGFNDKGSHASRGKTERNKIMFGPAGFWYPYFTYGMHWLLNIVTRENGYPAAILIREVKVRSGTSPITSGAVRITGPARVTKFFKVDGSFYGKKAGRASGLWVEDRGVKIKSSKIKTTTRVGIDYAGPYWSKRKYRFILS